MTDRTNGDVTRVDAAAATAEIQVNEERPAWLPEKFKTPEDMATSYAALEAKMAQPGVAPEAGAALEADGVAPAVEPQVGLEIPEVADAVDPEAEFDMTPFSEKATRGEPFTDEDYAALATQGYQRGMVDQFVSGALAQRELLTNKVYESVGGQEAYTAMAQWAATGQTAEQRAAFNAALATNDMATISMAVTALQSGYVAAHGVAPQNALTATAGSAPGVQPFANRAELMQAVNDPRYKAGDSAYHAEYDARLRISDIV